MNVEFKRRIRIGAGNFQAFFRLLDFLNPGRGWPFFCYVSHKVTRWFSPIFILLSAACCTVLSCISGAPFYRVLFVLGAVFVAVGLLHKIIPFKTGGPPLLFHGHEPCPDGRFFSFSSRNPLGDLVANRTTGQLNRIPAVGHRAP